MTITPALNILLGLDTTVQVDIDGSPMECPGCPFGTLVEPYEQVSNDVSEAHYDCTLLERRVWGEYAPCVRDDWQKRARTEIGRDG